jgi:nucleotide-binding universal stress UspA family protein
MAYKTILVHADLGTTAEERIRFAARLARTFDAHLTGCAPTGISRFIPPDVTVLDSTQLADFCAAMRGKAAEALRRFAQIALEEGVSLAEERMIDDDACGLGLHARYADLVVVSPPEESMPTRGSASELPGYLLRESGRPLLVVPPTVGRADLAGKVLLAWDGSMEATRAVIGALPMMRMARKVSVMHVNDGRSVPGQASTSCSEMAHYLRRQGVTAAVRHGSGLLDIGDALLSAANDADANLLVMGGYRRSPLRESLLGGVTASILQSMTIPVLVAH